MRPAKEHLQGQINPSRRQGAKMECNALAQSENLATNEAVSLMPLDQIGHRITSPLVGI